MKCVPKSWTIYTVNQRRNKINPRPQYQRAPVWNIAKQQRLIDSVLRGYDIPKIYLRESTDPKYEHEIVDGQQRLRAIWDFFSDLYSLSDEDSDDFEIWGDMSGKKHSELPSDLQDKFGLFELSIVIIEGADELEIRDIFLRLQEGVTLNPAEKRNAMVGKMRDFVAELADHSVFQHVKMPANMVNRYGKDDWIAHVVCLQQAGNIVDIKASNLQKLFKDNLNFDAKGKVAQRVKRVLNSMVKVLDPDTPEMDIKWGFVDLYWLISSRIDEYVLTNREEDIRNFYVTFEQRRRGVEDIEELVKSADPLDRALFEYIQAFQRSGAVKKNIQTRHEVYGEWLHNLIPDLVPKDPTRAYTKDERLIIWRRAHETCQICGKKVKFDEVHADHIVAHTKGGKTTIENSQCLCYECNQTKGGS